MAGIHFRREDHSGMASVESVEYLDLLQGVLGDFIIPTGPFNPSGQWFHQYRVYTLVNGRKPPLATLPKGEG